MNITDRIITGTVAQWLEHPADIRKVSGSSPFSSTIFKERYRTAPPFNSGQYASGQSRLTVNQFFKRFEGSNPSCPTTLRLRLS